LQWDRQGLINFESKGESMHTLIPLILSLALVAPVKSANISYLTDGSTNDVRFQFNQSKDRLSLYNEINIKNFGDTHSYQTSRVIIQYGFENIKFTAMGTYAPGYTQNVAGIGLNFGSFGSIVGVDVNNDPVGLLYGSYRINNFSSTGHIDLIENSYKGRLDTMYNFKSFKVGYEIQFKDDVFTNWVKASINF